LHNNSSSIQKTKIRRKSPLRALSPTILLIPDYPPLFQDKSPTFLRKITHKLKDFAYSVYIRLPTIIPGKIPVLYWAGIGYHTK